MRTYNRHRIPAKLVDGTKETAFQNVIARKGFNAVFSPSLSQPIGGVIKAYDKKNAYSHRPCASMAGRHVQTVQISSCSSRMFTFPLRHTANKMMLLSEGLRREILWESLRVNFHVSEAKLLLPTRTWRLRMQLSKPLSISSHESRPEGNDVGSKEAQNSSSSGENRTEQTGNEANEASGKSNGSHTTVHFVY
jgi:hypothetical protein